MIPLRLRADASGWSDGLAVVRLLTSLASSPTAYDLVFDAVEGDELRYSAEGRELRIRYHDAAALDGNVALLNQSRHVLQRLIRPDSIHNTFLVTERCDQLCVMCSQPPKAADWNLFDYYLEAARLAPRDAVIGISGGEPTLLKGDLFHFLETLGRDRPDLGYHILTNAQHFERSDTEILRGLPLDRIEWGVPVYASEAKLHDQVVGKEGAFQRLQESLALLAKAGARVEVRTVITALNHKNLPALASYLVANVPFAETWALMQLENIGYGKLNWDALFVDTGANFGPLGRAVSIATGRGLVPRLYNFPLCTVPQAFRKYAVASISDWKQKYLPPCSKCTLRATCGGFFEWYPEGKGFAEVRAE